MATFRRRWDEQKFTKEGIVARWPQVKEGTVSGLCEDKKNHHGHTHSCYIELGPVSGHQHNLKHRDSYLIPPDNLIFCDSEVIGKNRFVITASILHFLNNGIITYILIRREEGRRKHPLCVSLFIYYFFHSCFFFFVCLNPYKTWSWPQ